MGGFFGVWGGASCILEMENEGKESFEENLKGDMGLLAERIGFKY